MVVMYFNALVDLSDIGCAVPKRHRRRTSAPTSRRDADAFWTSPRRSVVDPLPDRCVPCTPALLPPAGVFRGPRFVW